MSHDVFAQVSYQDFLKTCQQAFFKDFKVLCFTTSKARTEKKVRRSMQSIDHWMAFNQINHHSNTTFFQNSFWRDREFWRNTAWKVRIDFRSESLRRENSFCLVLVSGFSVGLLSFEMLSGMFQREKAERSGRWRSGGVILIFRGIMKKANFHVFEHQWSGERTDRCVYALGDMGGYLGTLDDTLETRGNFSHLFIHDNPWHIEQGYELMEKGLSWKWMCLKGIGQYSERRGIWESLGNSISWTYGLWEACFPDFF